MARKKHPRGLVTLFFTEMWERFGFYLMLGIFTLYMIEPKDSNNPGLGFNNAQSADLMGTFLALVYLTPFLGGMLADRKIGYRISIVFGGCLMGLGYIALGIPPAWVADFHFTLFGKAYVILGVDIALYGSLGLIILGNGFFKPCISVLLGKLYDKDEYRDLKDSGFNIFYVGINIGAFVCNFVATFVRVRYGWGWAFVAAGIGMYIGVAWFLYGNFRVPEIGKADKISPPRKGEQGVFLTLACLFVPATIAGVIGWFAPTFMLGHALISGSQSADAFFAFSIPVIIFFGVIWYKAGKHEREPIAALLAIYAVVVVFWAIFLQSSTTLTYWAKEYTDRAISPTVARFIGEKNLEEVSTVERKYEKFDLNDKSLGETFGPSYYFDNLPKKEWPKGNVPEFTKEALAKNPALGRPQGVSEEDWKKLSLEERIAVAGRPGDVKDEDWKKIAPENRENYGVLKLWGTELQASINPFFIIILTPLVVGFFRFLGRRNREPSTPAKIGLGLVISGISLLVMATACYLSGGEGKTNAMWLVSCYAVITVGELCLSPMGLSLVTKLSPPRIVGVMMGGWMLSCALGNKLSGVMAGLWDVFPNKGHFFVVNSLLVFIPAGGILIILPWLRRIYREYVLEVDHSKKSDSEA